MSEDKTLQLPTTDEYPLPEPSSAPSGDDPKWNGWYILALFFGILSLAGLGFLMGQRLENRALDETLEAVTESVAEAESTAISQNRATGTAIVRNYTPTPTATFAPTMTATPEIPEGIILPIQVELREYPGEDAPVLEMVPQNTLVMVLGTTSDNQWLEINFYTKNSDIERGFIPADAIAMRGGDLAVLAQVPYPSATPTNTPFPTPIPSQTAVPTSTPVMPLAEVIGVSVPVYIIPVSDSALVAVLQQGDEVEINGVSQDNQWYEIQFVDADGNEARGFIPLDNLMITGGSLQAVPIAALAEPVEDTPIPMPTTPEVRSQGMLMLVRSGPNEIFEPVGYVDNETSLTANAISVDGQWLQVDYPASPTGLGWVSTSNIEILGTLQYLPVVQGPIPPTPEIEVVIEGNINVPSTASNQPPIASNEAPVITELPADFDVQLINIPELDIYAFNIGFIIVGTKDDAPYQSTIEIGVSEDQIRDQFKFEISTQGDDIGEFGDLADLLPIAVGGVDDVVYVYFGQDDFCFPSDEPTSMEDLFEGFAPFALASGELVNEFNQLGVFGLIEDHDLYGLSTSHYQFLGYRDITGEAEYEATDDMKVDLWFSADKSTLYAFSFTFNVQPGSEFGEAFIDELGFEGLDLTGFEGQVRLFALPKGFGDDASIYSEPPAACDLITD